MLFVSMDQSLLHFGLIIGMSFHFYHNQLILWQFIFSNSTFFFFLLNAIRKHISKHLTSKGLTFFLEKKNYSETWEGVNHVIPSVLSWKKYEIRKETPTTKPWIIHKRVEHFLSSRIQMIAFKIRYRKISKKARLNILGDTLEMDAKLFAAFYTAENFEWDCNGSDWQ